MTGFAKQCGVWTLSTPRTVLIEDAHPVPYSATALQPGSETQRGMVVSGIAHTGKETDEKQGIGVGV